MLKSPLRLVFLGVLALQFLALVFFFLLLRSPDSGFRSYLLGIGAYLSANIGIFCLFLRHIYQPVARIEQAIAVLESSHPDFAAETGPKKNYPLSDSLNNLLRRLKESMDREYESKMLKQQAELNSLQSQINPHFLYNTLESIRGQALKDRVPEIAQMTEALAMLFRYSISQKGNLVTLGVELKSIDNYFTIQQFRFNNKFELAKVFRDDQYLLNDYLIPKLTIQPIVENAIYHGLETKIGKGTITIRIAASSSRLILNIIDDGTGIEQSRLAAINEDLSREPDLPPVQSGHQATGLALRNVNKRIKLCFGEEYGLWVASTPGIGTDVEIVLPATKS